MANEITTDNINTKAQEVASVGDGDYVYIYKAGAQGFSRIEKSAFFQGEGGTSDIITEDNSNDSDLEFADEDGNVLLRLSDGHIETSNFDSREAGGTVDLSNYYTKSEVNALIGGGSSTPVSPLKILVIGNSYSCDSFSYLPFILKDSFGINIELGVYYRGGATTDDYLEKYTQNKYDDVYFSINTATQSSWSTYSSSYTPQTAVLSNTWDMIVLQQGSASSYDISNYASVQALYNRIKADAPYDFVLGWNINHIRTNQFGENNENWKNVLGCCKLQPATFVFPYGTAIFNVMEKYKDIPSTGAYLMYNNHLNEGLPCYLAAIANIQAIFDRYYPGLSVLGDTFEPNTTQRMGGSQAHGNIYEMSADNRYVCQCAAILANKDKFNVNPIS